MGTWLLFSSTVVAPMWTNTMLGLVSVDFDFISFSFAFVRMKRHCLLFRERFRSSSLPQHPFPDVRRTVENRDARRLTRVQKANALDIHKIHFIQIQRYSRSAASEFGLHLINLLSSKFAT